VSPVCVDLVLMWNANLLDWCFERSYPISWLSIAFFVLRHCNLQCLFDLFMTDSFASCQEEKSGFGNLAQQPF
jgi:hypothetical protein